MLEKARRKTEWCGKIQQLDERTDSYFCDSAQDTDTSGQPNEDLGKYVGSAGSRDNCFGPHNNHCAQGSCPFFPMLKTALVGAQAPRDTWPPYVLMGCPP